MRPFDLECQSCDKGWSPRWVGYFGAISGRDHARALIEVTANVAEMLAAEAEKRGSLRGWKITLSRIGDRPNGPLAYSTEHANIPDDQLPQCFDVKATLKRIWKVHEHLAVGTKKRSTVLTPDDPRFAGDYNADTFKSANGKAGS